MRWAPQLHTTACTGALCTGPPPHSAPPHPTSPWALQVLSLLNNLVSRRFEFQADGFAQSLGKAEPLKQSLLVLDKENKVSRGWLGQLWLAWGWGGSALLARVPPRSSPPRLLPCLPQGAVATDPLYSAWHLTHPPLSERLSALDAAAKKAE